MRRETRALPGGNLAGVHARLGRDFSEQEKEFAIDIYLEARIIRLFSYQGFLDSFPSDHPRVPPKKES
jgi:hypothetical protein